MSLPRPSEPLALPTRELRRLAHVVAVPTSYVNRDVATDTSEDRVAAAEREGYEEGFARGMAEAREELERARREQSRHVATLLEALRQAAVELRGAREGLRSEMRESAARLAFGILEQLLGRELAVAVNPGREAIIRTLELDDGAMPATVRMNPGDVARLGEVADLGLNRDITVIADPQIEIGGAVVEVGSATLDGRLGTALERVRRALIPAASAEVDDDRVA